MARGDDKIVRAAYLQSQSYELERAIRALLALMEQERRSAKTTT